MTRPNPPFFGAIRFNTADDVSWWDAFEDYLEAGHQWEEAAKLAWRDVDSCYFWDEDHK